MSEVKRYVVFAGQDYYPQPGWNDYRNSFDTFDEASARASELVTNGDPDGPYHWGREIDWAHIVDLTTGEIVYDSRDSDRW